MITLETFTDQFEQIAASFSRSMNAKHLESWYEEIRTRDEVLFKKACFKLKYGEKFPNFAMFRGAYQEVQASDSIGQPVTVEGCGWCHDKLVIWEDGDYSRSGKCKFCHEVGAEGLIDPRVIDNNPKLTLVKPSGGEVKIIPREALQELIGSFSSMDVAKDKPSEKLRAKKLSLDSNRDKGIDKAEKVFGF